MKRSLMGWMLLCILSIASFASAQSAFTSLRGTVKDPSGALVPGATVTIKDMASDRIYTATANAAGEYLFPQIPPAHYTITVTAAGFGSQSKTAELLVSQPATVDFALTVQATAVTVDVSGTAQTLNTTDASLGNSMGNDMIQGIPTETRNVPDLLALQPGVLYLPTTSDSRTGAVNGGRSDQGNITLDGIDNNDQINGTAFTGVLRQTQDAIQEFRVVTGGGNADSGRSSGAQISMITKSGTNKIHGAAYEYYRPTFVANDWFNKNAQVANGDPNIPGKYIRNIFGADLGGPIKKDKLFLFMNYEGRRDAINAQVSQTTATADYKNGILTYQNAGGDRIQLQPSDVAALDVNCTVVCNSPDYPNPPGPNPNVLKYLQSMPTANVPTAGGDAIGGQAYNLGTYTFSSHNPQSQNTYIARLDYTLSSRHSLFVRGQLQGDQTTGTEQFPGAGPSSVSVANNRGIIAGHTWTIKNNLINDVRYGYIRAGGGSAGVGGTKEYVDFRGISTPTSEGRTSVSNTPVNNIVETLTWNKGNHSLSFGFNWRGVSHNSLTDGSSYDSASTNPSWFSGGAPLPGDGVSSAFATSYKWEFVNLVGAIPSRTNNYNYHLDSATSATALPEGAAVERHFKANEYEGYAQDSWRIRPNLTFTYGLRYTILQTPWETKGQEVLPTVDTHEWFVNRGKAAATGQVNQPDLSFAPGGKFYGKPGFFDTKKNNFAPRLALAYAPTPHTSFRAGAGLYYDHYGEAMVNTLSRTASYGMSTSITNPASHYTVESNPGSSRPAAPRFTDRNTLPNIDLGVAPPLNATFPYTYPEYSLAIKSGVDNHINSPYSTTFDLSFQHEFPGGLTFEAAYVGRLGRRLLQNLDIAEPTDYVDPQGGGDYFSNADKMSAFADAHLGPNDGYIYDDDGNPIGSTSHIDPIPYFEDVFPWMKNFAGLGESATQAIYNYEWAWARYSYGETNAIYDLDLCYDGCPGDWVPHFFQNQFSSFYAISSIGSSSYHSGQFTLRHPLSHGFAGDISYTWAKSIDMGSDTEAHSFFGGSSLSAIYNSWKPGLNKGVSEFDTRHLITADYLYLLPFGRGKAVAGNANYFLDAVIGGWQLAGSLHWSSALPFSLYDPGWNTNWELSSYTVNTSPLKEHRHIDASTYYQYFEDGDAVSSGGYVGKPERLSYPGEAGERNFFRGDGYFDLDSGLSKTWKAGEFGKLKFSCEIYNVTNTVRFDPQSITAQLIGTGLGQMNSNLSKKRVLQGSLRWDF